MKVLKVLSLGIGCLSVLLFTPSVRAEMLRLGTSSGGQLVRIDTHSIERNGGSGSSWSSFTYYLDNEPINARAHCGRGIWRVDGEEKEYQPQSQATRNMLSLVCSVRDIESDSREMVIVFAPPSHVRSSPGGTIICTIDSMQVIPISSGSNRGWFYTNVCGGGWIHQSQIRRFP